jgi:hypothetical protein
MALFSPWALSSDRFFIKIKTPRDLGVSSEKRLFHFAEICCDVSSGKSLKRKYAFCACYVPHFQIDCRKKKGLNIFRLHERTHCTIADCSFSFSIMNKGDFERANVTMISWAISRSIICDRFNFHSASFFYDF